MPNFCKFPLGTLADLTASEAAAGMAAEKYTSEALVHACLERILAIEPEVHAWAYLDTDRVLEQAQVLDKSPRRGPLHGVPFGLKDIIDTVDMPTGHGSPIYAGNQPSRDAACVAACRAAGGLVLGKTVTTEFAHRHPGPTRNPWNTGHTPGGSSSGSAAAVGARMVPVAFGTQTTGSTIRPAAYCGTVGYKPSYGDFSLTGIGDNVPSFDTLGLIARSVDDLALFRYVVMGLDQRLLDDVAVKGLTVGFCRTAFWNRADAATQALLERTADALAAAGAVVCDFDMPDGEAALPEIVRKVSGFEFARVMTYERLNHGDRLSRALLDGRVADGLNCSYEDYRASRKVVHAYRRRLCAALEAVDILLTPAAPGEAPEGIGATGDAIFNNVWTTTHVPAVTLPAGTGVKGLPLGVQLVGRLHQDHRLLEIARAVRRRVLDGA
jgi:Asp-tRNA(Asn)/Glu-tRNA(Gln) amidotransferase A subunit family amidase